MLEQHTNMGNENTKCSISCHDNKDIGAQMFCMTCGQTLCKSCHQLHEENAHFKGKHINIPIASFTVSIKCQKHGDLIQAYCTDCSVPVCRICPFTTHHAHSVQDFCLETENISELISGRMKEAIQNLDELGMNQDTFKQQISVLHEMLKEHKVKVIQQIEETEKTLHQQLDTELQMYNNRVSEVMTREKQAQTYLEGSLTQLKFLPKVKAFSNCGHELGLYGVEHQKQDLKKNIPAPEELTPPPEIKLDTTPTSMDNFAKLNITSLRANKDKKQEDDTSKKTVIPGVDKKQMSQPQQGDASGTSAATTQGKDIGVKVPLNEGSLNTGIILGQQSTESDPLSHLLQVQTHSVVAKDPDVCKQRRRWQMSPIPKPDIYSDINPGRPMYGEQLGALLRWQVEVPLNQSYGQYHTMDFNLKFMPQTSWKSEDDPRCVILYKDRKLDVFSKSGLIQPSPFDKTKMYKMKRIDVHEKSGAMLFNNEEDIGIVHPNGQLRQAKVREGMNRAMFTNTGNILILHGESRISLFDMNGQLLIKTRELEKHSTMMAVNSSNNLTVLPNNNSGILHVYEAIEDQSRNMKSTTVRIGRQRQQTFQEEILSPSKHVQISPPISNINPHQLCTDSDDNLYIIANNSTVVKLSSEGKYLGDLGKIDGNIRAMAVWRDQYLAVCTSMEQFQVDQHKLCLKVFELSNVKPNPSLIQF